MKEYVYSALIKCFVFGNVCAESDDEAEERIRREIKDFCTCVEMEHEDCNPWCSLKLDKVRNIQNIGEADGYKNEEE